MRETGPVEGRSRAGRGGGRTGRPGWRTGDRTLTLREHLPRGGSGRADVSFMLWPFRLSSGISARNLSIIGRRRRSPPAGRPGGIVAAMRRPVIALVVVLAALGLFAGGLAWLLETPEPPAGASRGVRLY